MQHKYISLMDYLLTFTFLLKFLFANGKEPGLRVRQNQPERSVANLRSFLHIFFTLADPAATK